MTLALLLIAIPLWLLFVMLDDRLTRILEALKGKR